LALILQGEKKSRQKNNILINDNYRFKVEWSRYLCLCWLWECPHDASCEISGM